MKNSWVEIRAGRDHSPVTIMGKTDSGAKQTQGMGVALPFTLYLCCSFILRGRTSHALSLLQCEVPPMGDSPP